MNHEYASHEDYPKRAWKWPDFTPREMRSKGDGKLMIDPDSMDKLQRLRNLVKAPMRITSAYRSPAHNRKVGGAQKSQHLLAKAFDVHMDGHDPAQYEAAARKVGFTSIGFYPKQNFIHIDTRDRAATWGERWFPKADKFIGYGVTAGKPATQEPTKQPKARKRPVSGGLAAALASIVAAVFEILSSLKKGTRK